MQRLLDLFARLPPPPDPVGLYPRYGELKERFLAARRGGDEEETEEAFLTLYAHLHGNEAPYTPGERRRLDETRGYWCHAGGISPILRALPLLEDGTVLGDFGAGNGLQGLLIQALRPHRKTIQIEISSRMVTAGRALQEWLSIPRERVEWIVGDVLDHTPEDMDFAYLYRPVRPEGEGRKFYERFGAALAGSSRTRIIFSVADCLRDFLPPDFTVFYADGHLTCYRR